MFTTNWLSPFHLFSYNWGLWCVLYNIYIECGNIPNTRPAMKIRNWVKVDWSTENWGVYKNLRQTVKAKEYPNDFWGMTIQQLASKVDEDRYHCIVKKPANNPWPINIITTKKNIPTQKLPFCELVHLDTRSNTSCFAWLFQKIWNLGVVYLSGSR